MADRYWVGGSATWDNANTAVWSDTSGGAGGASVPTAADNAIFDANSGAVTVTLATSQVVTCLNFDCSAFTGTIAGGGNTANGLDVFGSFTLSAGMTYTTKVALRFKSTATGNTITTAGKSMPSDGGNSFMYFLGVGGEWSLQDALTQVGSNGLVVTNGTFNSNGYNVTLGTNGFSSTGTAARTINFGASTIDTRRWTLSGSNYSLTQTGSMTVKDTGGTLTFSGNGESYGSVTFTTAAFNVTHVINGANTFANLTLTTGGRGYTIGLRLGADQIVTGTFSSVGIAPATGLWLFALVGDINSSTQRTITAATYSVSNTYFVSTVIAGAGAPISGSTLGDLGNNSGITFSAPVTYYALNVTNNFSDTRRWSLTSGGSTANAVPLPQDIAVLDANTGSGTISGSSNAVYTGTIDSTNYTGSFSSTFRLAGSLTVGSSVASAAATFVFVGDTNTSITSNGKTITSVSASKSSGTFTVNDNLACGNFGSGSGNFTLDLNNKTIDISNGLSTGGCILDFKTSSVINISGNSRTVITDGNQANGTFAGTPSINLTYSGGTGTRTITYGAGKTPAANNIIPINVTAGTDLVVFGSNAKIGSVDFTGFSGTWTGASGTTANLYGDLTLSSTMSVATISGNRTVNFAATSGTHTITSNGTSLTVNALTFNGVGGSWVLGDALEGPTTLTLTNGTFNADAYNVTAGTFASSNSNIRTLDMGDGLWTLSGTGFAWNTGSATNLTLNKGTANILLSNDTSTGRTFSGGGKAYNKLTIGGATSTSTTSIAGSNSYTELASIKTVAHTISFQSNQGTIDTWSVTGTSGNVVTVVSSSTGTRRTFSLTNSTEGLIDFLNVRDLGVTQPDLFFVGDNSTDSGNNLNVIFASAPVLGTGNFFMIFN